LKGVVGQGRDRRGLRRKEGAGKESDGKRAKWKIAKGREGKEMGRQE
jgi:hypothetical protein